MTETSLPDVSRSTVRPARSALRTAVRALPVKRSLHTRANPPSSSSTCAKRGTTTASGGRASAHVRASSGPGRSDVRSLPRSARSLRTVMRSSACTPPVATIPPGSQVAGSEASLINGPGRFRRETIGSTSRRPPGSSYRRLTSSYGPNLQMHPSTRVSERRARSDPRPASRASCHAALDW